MSTPHARASTSGNEPLFPLSVPEAVARIEAREPHLHAFVSTRLPEAIREHEARIREPARTPLHAVPFALKDEWETKALPTTGGSWRFRDRNPGIDSAVFRAFADAGAILLGKTNLSDLGLAPEATSWVGGSTRNPHDPQRTAGGSSGGAAAAVADGMVGFDWGTDIGGSIRQPAGNCGVFGLRLASETWPIRDLFPTVPEPLTWLCAQGPLTRTLPQMRAILETVRPALRTGPDRGPFVAREAVIYAPDHPGQWPRFAADVAPALERAIGKVGSDHGLPGTRRAQWIYNGVWCAHLDEIAASDPSMPFWQALFAVLSAVCFRGLFGDKRYHPLTAELLLQIAVGRYTLFWSKKKALARARAVQSGFQRLWDRGAVVVMPVCAWPAAKIGRTNCNPRILECTVPGNMADATGLAIPWDRFPDGLPRAIQLLGPPGSELTLIDLAEAIARARNP